eukprot:Em0014g670a
MAVTQPYQHNRSEVSSWLDRNQTAEKGEFEDKQKELEKSLSNSNRAYVLWRPLLTLIKAVSEPPARNLANPIGALLRC